MLQVQGQVFKRGGLQQDGVSPARMWSNDVLPVQVWVTLKVCLPTWNKSISALRHAAEMFLTILKMGEHEDYNGIGLRLQLCSWESWKIKDSWLLLEISSLFLYAWRTFIFHDLGEDSSHLKPFSLSWPCSLISKMVSWASVGHLRAEILIFEDSK